jgi:hypothetical protein
LPGPSVGAILVGVDGSEDLVKSILNICVPSENFKCRHQNVSAEIPEFIVVKVLDSSYS